MRCKRQFILEKNFICYFSIVSVQNCFTFYFSWHCDYLYAVVLSKKEILFLRCSVCIYTFGSHCVTLDLFSFRLSIAFMPLRIRCQACKLSHIRLLGRNAIAACLICFQFSIKISTDLNLKIVKSVLKDSFSRVFYKIF